MSQAKLPLCAAFGCCEPVQTPHSDLCVGHQRVLWEFSRWLNGFDDSSARTSFAVARLAWDRAYRDRV